MKRQTKTVWYDNTNGELLTSVPGGGFYVACAMCSPQKLSELRDAIDDALLIVGTDALVAETSEDYE